MRNTLIDAGPLIALFDKSDQYHRQAVNFIRMVQTPLITTWPVVTETSHMLNFSTIAQVNFLKWIDRGGLKIHDIDQANMFRLIDLTEKFSDVPMDLADASLIVASEQTGAKEIASIDGDFYIYRNIRNQYLTNVFLVQ
jgi:uncharacterized protein